MGGITARQKLNNLIALEFTEPDLKVRNFLDGVSEATILKRWRAHALKPVSIAFPYLSFYHMILSSHMDIISGIGNMSIGFDLILKNGKNPLSDSLQSFVFINRNVIGNNHRLSQTTGGQSIGSENHTQLDIDFILWGIMDGSVTVPETQWLTFKTLFHVPDFITLTPVAEIP